MSVQFFQMESPALQFRNMISGGGVEVDESRLLGILILVIATTLARPPFLLECKPILHHSFVLVARTIIVFLENDDEK